MFPRYSTRTRTILQTHHIHTIHLWWEVEKSTSRPFYEMTNVTEYTIEIEKEKKTVGVEINISS